MNLDRYLKQTHFADIETRGFWEDVNTLEDVWCLCSVTEDDEVLLFHDYPEFDNQVVWDDHDEKEYTIPERVGTLMEGFRYWYKIGMQGGKLSIHNAFGYDKVIIEKVVPKCKINTEVFRDTLNQSKVQWFSRPCPKGAKSPHGLKAFGIKFGINKPDITDWTTMDAYKLHRVVEDCKIQKMTQLFLDKEAEALKTKLGIDFSECKVIEDEYTWNNSFQEINGALADVPHMEKCVEWLDSKTAELSAIIEPILPPSLKVGSSKITKKEVVGLLGYDNSKIPVEYEEVNRNGELIKSEVKEYYKPSINFYKVDKVKYYSGFNISYGQSPKFLKKKGFTDWRNTNHPHTKPKEWEVDVEEIETKTLNKNTCDYFEVEPTDTDLICGAHTRVSFSPSKMTQHEVVKGYLIALGWKEADEWNLKKDKDKQIVKAEVDTVVSYPTKAVPENQMHFKVKKGEALVTSPKLTEKDHDSLPEGVGKDIAEYNTYMHRRRFLLNFKDPDEKGLLAYVREDGRIPCRVNNFMTETGRSSQGVWVNAPSESALFGEEIRKSIIAPEGRVVVGADMKSAQLAIAAYYAKNSTYYNAVASGNEVVKDPQGNEVYVGESAHCFSARAFDIVSHLEWQDAVDKQNPDLLHSIALRRKKSKGASFGVIFGCSGKKLAGMLGIHESEGNAKKEAFLNQMGLKGVQKWLKTCKNKYKRGSGWYIPLPFGYWVYCKSDHKAINYIIQGTEAACQKVAVNYFEREKCKQKLDCVKILDVHDEFLVESSLKDCDKVGALMCEAYTYASDKCYEWHLNNSDKFANEGKPVFKFDLDGGYKVGKNYYEVH